MLWIDTKYLKMISPRLEKFVIKQETPNFLANCRCPICGDSSHSKKKARGYFYGLKGNLHYKCHNCGTATYFNTFLKGFDINLYKSYAMEKFIQTREPVPERKEIDETMFVYRPVTLSSVINTEAEKYLADRLIPRDQWGRLYYAKHFFKWAAENTDKFKEYKDKDHPRLIIPWFNENGDMFAYQGRSLHNEEPRYYTVMLNRDEPEKVFGFEQINKNETVYVLEGALDSLFIPNSVAVGSSALHKFHHPELDVVYIPDADYRNKEVVALINTLVKGNERVCLLPHSLPGKDINQCVQNGVSIEELLNIIRQNTFSGAELSLKFAMWRRV
jgi:hypothetical protein